MTIEEKAKAYDEALEKAKSMINDLRKGEDILAVSDLESMFPELKESEDERIRKRIIKFLIDVNNGAYTKSELEIASWIGWLEKQGEQSLANKVEPKFHEGDWAVSNLDGKARQVSEVHFDEYNSYYVVDGKSVNLEEYDRLHHLWTIQDAKDGDVLVASDGSIFIFKGTIDYACKYYVALTTDRVIKFNEGLEHYWETSKAVHPATKEQRDLLFQKMKEAGYEWDKQEKRLIKVPKTKEETGVLKQLIDKGNPAWSEEDERLCSCLIEDQKNALDNVRNDKYGHSEIISDLKEMYRERIEWLESLKDRYTWKPSDEQLDALHDAAVYVDKSMFPYPKGILMKLYKQLKKLREE